MDFLNDIKKKLEEIEEFSQQQQQQQQASQQQAARGLFQPRGESSRGAQPPGKRGGRQPQQQRQPAQVGRQQAPARQTPQAKRSRRPVDSESCPVEEWRGQESQTGLAAGEESIFDNLGGRLDEAFLLQEVLGPPRCVRGWDE